MIPFSVLEKRLMSLSQEQVDIILQIRDMVARLVPDAVERLDRKGITYYNGEKGGPVKAGICQIFFEPDFLRLAFIHGAFLPDPAKLLIGGAEYKRFMILKNFDEVPWDSVLELITASAHFDPMKLVA
jgi:hypothetical protein